MNLDNFYSLRKNFVIIGLTGRVGAGCTELANKLSSPNYVKNLVYNSNKKYTSAKEIKFNICYNYLKSKNNFEEFKIVNYKNVLLLHLIFESSKEDDPIEYIISVLTQYGDGFENYNGIYTNRFGLKHDAKFIIKIKKYLKQEIYEFVNKFKKVEHSNLLNWLKDEKNVPSFSNCFFESFKIFSDEFYKLLNDYNITKRTRFNHDISINLREVGKCLFKSKIKSVENLINPLCINN